MVSEAPPAVTSRQIIAGIPEGCQRRCDPSGIECALGLCSGGVAALDRRLMAVIPSGSDGIPARSMALIVSNDRHAGSAIAIAGLVFTPQGFELLDGGKRSATTGYLAQIIHRIPEGCQRRCDPSGIECALGLCSGGVALLNRRLMAVIPSGSDGIPARSMALIVSKIDMPVRPLQLRAWFLPRCVPAVSLRSTAG